MRHLYILGAAALVLLTVSYAGAMENAGAGQPEKAGVMRKEASAGSSIADRPTIFLKNIPPLYTDPKMPGEGIWVKQDLSEGHDSADFVYRTFYRPSEQFPNSTVYMMLLNMKQISARLYLGSAEPYRGESPSKIEEPFQPYLLAVTNALWQTRHSGKGGVIFRGQVLKEMEPGVASIVIYKNGSVDIVEWNDKIPVSEIQDARQLYHLIAKEGKVVTSVVRRGRIVPAEIGLGSLLDEDNPVVAVPATAPGEKPSHKLNFTSGDLWFLATRSAFGIRPDGNLVFAVGHHTNTYDLSKALVLAGCVRAIHGDANPGNSVGILYFRNSSGKIVKKAALSPLQDKSTLDRYLKGSYPKDFIGFFRHGTIGD